MISTQSSVASNLLQIPSTKTLQSINLDLWECTSMAFQASSWNRYPEVCSVARTSSPPQETGCFQFFVWVKPPSKLRYQWGNTNASKNFNPSVFLCCHKFYDFPELFGGITDCRLTSTGGALQVKWLSPALRKLSLLEQHANQLLPDVQKWNNDVKQPMFWWTEAAEVYFSENLCTTEVMPRISDSMHSTNIHSRASIPVHSLVVWIANWKQNFEQTMDFEQSGHTNQLCFLPEFKLSKLLPTRRFISWSLWNLRL